MKIGNYSYKLRKVSWSDYQFCVRLAKSNMINYFIKYNKKWNSKTYKQNFEPKNTFIVLYKNKRIAFFRINIQSDCLFLNDMQVSKKMQGKGIGTGLMNIIERIALKNNKNKIGLNVFIDNPAVNLYKKIGYRVIKEKDNSYLMEKNL